MPRIPDSVPTHGLVVRRPWIQMLLAGRKTWEIRGSDSSRRGPIALIEGGTGMITGVVTMTGTVGPITPERFATTVRRHRVPFRRGDHMHYRRTFAWVMANPLALLAGVKYAHPSGAVIWVTLSETTRAALAVAMRRAARAGAQGAAATV